MAILKKLSSLAVLLIAFVFSANVFATVQTFPCTFQGNADILGDPTPVRANGSCTVDIPDSGNGGGTLTGVYDNNNNNVNNNASNVIIDGMNQSLSVGDQITSVDLRNLVGDISATGGTANGGNSTLDNMVQTINDVTTKYYNLPNAMQWQGNQAMHATQKSNNLCVLGGWFFCKGDTEHDEKGAKHQLKVLAKKAVYAKEEQERTLAYNTFIAIIDAMKEYILQNPNTEQAKGALGTMNKFMEDYLNGNPIAIQARRNLYEEKQLDPEFVADVEQKRHLMSIAREKRALEAKRKSIIASATVPACGVKAYEVSKQALDAKSSGKTELAAKLSAQAKHMLQAEDETCGENEQVAYSKPTVEGQPSDPCVGVPEGLRGEGVNAFTERCASTVVGTDGLGYPGL